MTPLERLVGNFSQGSIAWDVGGLAACLLLAYALCWFLGRSRPADSVWFGRHLAWLARDDEVVRAKLSEEWLGALAPYLPEPFRNLG